MSCAGWFIARSLNGPGQSPDKRRIHKSLTLFLAVAQRLLYRPPHGRQLVPWKARLGADGPGHVGLRRRLSICSHTQFLPFFRRSLPVAHRALRSVFSASKRSPSGLRVHVTTVCAPPLSVALPRKLQRGGIARCPPQVGNGFAAITSLVQRGDGIGGGRSMGPQPASRCSKRLRAQPHGSDSSGGELSYSTCGWCVQGRVNFPNAVARISATGNSDSSGSMATPAWRHMWVQLRPFDRRL